VRSKEGNEDSLLQAIYNSGRFGRDRWEELVEDALVQARLPSPCPCYHPWSRSYCVLGEMRVGATFRPVTLFLLRLVFSLKDRAVVVKESVYNRKRHYARFSIIIYILN
jgi:hypothetical protein